MLSIRFGTTSAFRGSARSGVVSFASLDPADTGFRKIKRNAVDPLSSRLSQLRSLVSGLASQPPVGPASPSAPSDHPAAASTSTQAAAFFPVLSPEAPSPNHAGRACTSAGPSHPDQRASAPAPTFDLPQGALHNPTPAPQPTLGHAPHHHAKRPRHQHHHPDGGHHHNHNQHRQRSVHFGSAAAQPPRHLQHQHQPLHQHPTLRLIASRLHSGSKPGARTDGARLGLVVEGGGMRGCISGAMLMALHDLGCTDVFDAVYGASAGAINATYFLTGQRHGLRIYLEDLTQGSAFLNFRNLLSGSSRPVMNIDFLIDQVMCGRKPLDWDAVLASPTPLKVVASCLDSLRPVLLADFADREELAAALKATAAVPQIAGPPRVVRGRTLVDAAVFEPVPLPSALRDGCSHVLVLCTRPAPTRRSPWARRVRSTIEVLAKTTVLNAPYMRDAWRAAHSEQRCSPAHHDEQLLAALRSCPHEFRASSGAYVLPLYPDHTAGCHPLCLDPGKLLAACNVGRQTLMALMAPVVAEAARGLGATAAAGEGVAADRGAEGWADREGGEVVAGEQGLVGGLGGVSWAAAVASGLGSAGGCGEFGGAELYSEDMDLRFRP